MTPEEQNAADEAVEAKRVQDETDAQAVKDKEVTDAKAQEEADKIARGDSTDEGTGDADDTAAKTAAAETAAASDAGEEKSKKSQMVPKGRLDTKNRMLDDANSTIRDLEAKLKASGSTATAGLEKQHAGGDTSTRIETAETAYAAARKDGDVDAEVKAMQEIRAAEKELRVIENNDTRVSAVNEATETAKFNEVLDILEADHPEINPKNYDPDDPKAAYNQDVVDELVDLKEAFILRGHSSSEAIIRAAGYVFSASGDGSDEVSEARDKKKAERDAAAKKTALGAAGTTAPDTKNAGASGDSSGAQADLPDSSKLSEEEFDALPEAMKRRMRGDEVG